MSIRFGVAVACVTQDYEAGVCNAVISNVGFGWNRSIFAKL